MIFVVDAVVDAHGKAKGRKDNALPNNNIKSEAVTRKSKPFLTIFQVPQRIVIAANASTVVHFSNAGYKPY
jgi:hypothetical protein